MNLPSLQPTTDRHAETIIKAVITPEQALEWLEHRNLQNRRVNEAKVRQYAEEMRQGSWSLTHQPIAFDVRGVLIDGQHRLWAIVESDVAADLFVFFNIDPQALPMIDVDQLELLVQQAHECDVKQIAEPPEPLPVTRQALRMLWHFRCNLEAAMPCRRED